MRQEFLYKPQGDTLERYILSDTQRTMIMGPLGSGKTNASCWKGFRLINAQEPDASGVRKSRGIAIRNTYPDLFSTTVKDWLDCFEDLGKFSKGGLEPPTHYLKYKLEDGTTVKAEVMFLALDREDHIKKLRGIQATWGWLNEVKEIPYAVIQMLDLRTGRYPKDVLPTWHGIFGDTNAPDNDHWYYRMAEELQPDGWTFLRQPGGVTRATPDSPWVVNGQAENIQNLPKNYYLNGLQGKSDAWITVNLANEYGLVTDGKPVYPDYKDSTHCRAFELTPNIPIHIGIDFGLTPAATIAQKMPNGQWRTRYEFVTEDTGVIRFAGLFKDFLNANCAGFKVASITGDPAGDQRQVGDREERTVFDLLRVNGIDALPAETNDFSIRTEAVSTPLRRMIDGEPGFLLHPECRVTRKGMQGAYKFRRLKVAGDERYEYKPVKNSESHPCESLQYLLMGGGEGAALLITNSQSRRGDAAAYRAKRGYS
jgi:hypothetical protein